MVTFLHLVYQVVYLQTGYRVKSGCRFVIQHNFRVQYQRSGYSYPFLHSTRKFRRHLVDRMLKADTLRRLEQGEIEIHRETMALGDVIVRDVRAVHRGTPNLSDEPRPMVVIGYSRRWLHRPEVDIRVPKSTHAAMSARGRQLVRFNPIVDDDQVDVAGAESYRAFAY